MGPVRGDPGDRLILLPSRPCPPEILARTRNANSAHRRALAAGWTATVSFALGGDDEAEVQSIILRLAKVGDRLTARWSGPLGQESLNFDGAWRMHPERFNGMFPINYTEFSWAIDGDGDKPLTKGQQEALDKDQAELLAAMSVASTGLDARPITVVPQGTTGRWCSGSVMREGGGLPAMKLKCINPALFGDNLCGGPCRASVEG